MLFPQTPAVLWTGRICSGLAIAFLSVSAVLKLIHHPLAVNMFTEMGFQESVLLPMGIAEVTCVVLYLIPATSVLGCVLSTAYLGGAVASHVHANQPAFVPIILGILLWTGLGLREPRLQELLPVRRS
jgi:hypothetical protein